MPIPISEKKSAPVVVCDYRLAINVDDVIRLSQETRQRLLVGRLNQTYFKVDGRAEPEAALEFCCPILEAAVICDVIRHQDIGVEDKVCRVYINRQTTWKRVPASAVLTVVDKGKPTLNREIFSVEVETAGADVHEEDVPCPICGSPVFETKSGTTCTHGHGGVVPRHELFVEPESSILSTEIDDQDEPATAFFQDMVGQTHANGSWLANTEEVTTPDGRKVRRQKPKPIPVLASPKARTFTEHYERWKDCQLCPLGEQRTQVVLCRGQLPADVLYCAEAPGISEDALGSPMVGPAGIKIDEIDVRAFAEHKHLRRAWVNLVACFPREAKELGINEPDGEDIQACAERLREIVSLARPRLVVYVGSLAEKWFPRCVPNYTGPTVHILHPANILRMPDIRQGLEYQRCIVAVQSAVKKFLS